MAATTRPTRPALSPGHAGASGRGPAGIPPLWAAGAATAATGLSVAAIAVGLSAPPGGPRGLVAAIHVLLIAVPVAVGLYALSRDPASRFARLVIAVGFLWAPTLLASSPHGAPYSVGRIAAWIGEVAVVGLVLSFPYGRLAGGPERALFGAAVAVFAVLCVPAVLLVADYPAPSPWSACTHNCPANAFALPHATPAADSPFSLLRDLASIAVWLVAIATLARRAARASWSMRRSLLPIVSVAMVALLLRAAFVVARRVDQWGSVTRALGFLALLALPGVVVAFFLGLVRLRFVASSALRHLTEQFSAVSSGSEVRDHLAAELRDDSLQIAYRAGDPGRWVDESGQPVTLPRDDPARTVTEVTAHGRRVAAIVHDAAGAAEHLVRDVAEGFALMALENRRLDAELRASFRELAASRARILSAVDHERRRIERDLHDGAQQRLVALRVSLELAREALPDDPDAAARQLDRLAADADATLDEVRSLARGVYPPLLADHGVAEALRMAARTGSMSVTVRDHGFGRYSQAIESAVYFICLEALQNAAKHSGASSATVTLWEDGDRIGFRVADDGRGIRGRPPAGSGVHNMRDRVASRGGTFAIDSTPGQGTSVSGTVPIGAARHTTDAEMLLQRATDALDDGFAILKAVRDGSGTAVDFSVEHLNDAAGRDTGRPAESQVGRTLGSLDAAYLSSELFAWHRAALESDGPSVLEDVVYEQGPHERRLRTAHEVRAVPMGAGRLVVTWRDITERKRHEIDLQLQSKALDRAAEGLCVIRASDGVIVYANLRFAEIYGYAPGELDGLHVAVLDADEPAGAAERRAMQIAAEVEAHGEARYEVLNRRKDGTTVWSEARTIAFDHPEHGRVWVAVQQDVTERRRAQDALRLAEERTRTAIRAAPVVLYTMDQDLRYTWVLNSEVGLGGDQTPIGRTDAELFGPRVGRRLTRLNRAALRGVTVHAQLRLDLPRGRVTLDITVSPRRRDGRICGVAGTAYDVTHDVAGRAVDPVLEEGSVGTAILSEDLAFLEASPALGELLGRSPDELRDMTLADVVAREDLPDLVAVVAARRGDTASPRRPIDFIDRAGRTRSVWLQAFDLAADRHGVPPAIALVVLPAGAPHGRGAETDATLAPEPA